MLLGLQSCIRCESEIQMAEFSAEVPRGQDSVSGHKSHDRREPLSADQEWAKHYREGRAAYERMGQIDKNNVANLVDSILKNDLARIKEIVCSYKDRPSDFAFALPSIQTRLHTKLDPGNRTLSLDELGYSLSASDDLPRHHAGFYMHRQVDPTDRTFLTDDCDPPTS
jgi:hypothetical protein